MQPTRRQFLKAAGAVSVGFWGLRTFYQTAASALAAETTGGVGYGPLVPDPAGVLNLPAGFSYRIISKMGERMDDGLFVPGQHDGMAAFAGPNGRTLLVRNHELTPDALAKSPFGPNNELFAQVDRSKLYDAGFGKQPALGGTTTLVYDTRTGTLERHFLSLAGTVRNCAGGPTPWGTWITCEETNLRAGETCEQDHGYNFEVPATAEIGLAEPVALRAMGRLNHEAVAVDPASGIVYQTEDRADGLIYRFVPNRPGELAAGGRLQALCAADRPSLDTRNWPELTGAARVAEGEVMAVRWLDLENVESPEDDLRLQGFAKGAARFARGEGMWYGRESVYFACTVGGHARKGQIWRYVPSPFEGEADEARFPGRLELFIEPNDRTLIENADNLTVSPWGDLVVCEDGADEQFVVGVTPEGRCYKLAENAGNRGEFAGATFSPDGTTLFVNIQVSGVTLAITGPWGRGNF